MPKLLKRLLILVALSYAALQGWAFDQSYQTKLLYERAMEQLYEGFTPRLEQ
jgi:hypothetical protein